MFTLLLIEKLRTHHRKIRNNDLEYIKIFIARIKIYQLVLICETVNKFFFKIM